MTTLVTGGTGYVGGALVRALRRRGERVRVLARKTSRTDELVRLGVEIAIGDILDRASVEQALDGCDTLYHAAAIYEYWTPDRALQKRTTVEGARNVLAAAQARGVGRVIYTSTSYTIGEPRGQMGTEETPHRGYFFGVYDEAKYHAEQAAWQFVRQGLPVIILNPSGIFGPGPLKAVGKAMLDTVTGQATDAVPRPGQPCIYRRRGAGPPAGGGERPARRTVHFERLQRRRCRIFPGNLPAGGDEAAAGGAAIHWSRCGQSAGAGRPVHETAAGPAQGGCGPACPRHAVDGSKAGRELGLRYTPLEEAIARTLAYYWQQGWLQQKPACRQNGVAAGSEVYAGGKQE